MKMIDFQLTSYSQFAFLEFHLEESIPPEVLKTTTPPDPILENFAHKGIILSGRGPIWLYGFLVHYYHPTKFVAVFDPRLEGAVVVESHGSEWEVGDIIPKSDWTILENTAKVSA